MMYPVECCTASSGVCGASDRAAQRDPASAKAPHTHTHQTAEGVWVAWGAASLCQPQTRHS